MDHVNEMTITIGKAEDESDINGYAVYWSNIIMRFAFLTSFAKTGSEHGAYYANSSY
ncbi:hypothetical protein [Halalkalibacter sp. APA_J-10(15)]|uniref:hypothetical protein n=1 Tax=Halalkalibacter sp. APA_J-10(15) TaxID=2933805 RepID=UPI001FF67893|nr:hypothetical protein [Halalkalibacter sp. APA_J-10(15)]